MSIASDGSLSLVLKSLRNGTATLGGGMTTDAEIDQVLSDGTIGTAWAFNRQVRFVSETILDAGPNLVVDLDAEPAPPDATLGLIGGQVRVILARASSANTVPIAILSPTVNGWEGITLQTQQVPLYPGQIFFWAVPAGSAIIDATHKLIEFDALGADAVLDELVILGATA